ncbi:hypothetical protein L9F63_006026, partial [Diploptera punctata]
SWSVVLRLAILSTVCPIYMFTMMVLKLYLPSDWSANQYPNMDTSSKKFRKQNSTSIIDWTIKQQSSWSKNANLF